MEAISTVVDRHFSPVCDWSEINHAKVHLREGYCLSIDKPTLISTIMMLRRSRPHWFEKEHSLPEYGLHVGDAVVVYRRSK